MTMEIGNEIKRGEIWIANLTDTKKEKTSKQLGIRPVVIIQNDVGNKYSPTVIVAVITSNKGKHKLPTHVEIGEESGLNKPSLVLLEQIVTIDKIDLFNKLGKAPQYIMNNIDKALLTSGGIDLQKLLQENKPIFNLLKANKMVEGIKELDDFIINYRPKNINGLLRSRQSQILTLKDYCNDFSVDYLRFYNEILMNNQINKVIYENEGDGGYARTV